MIMRLETIEIGSAINKDPIRLEIVTTDKQSSHAADAAAISNLLRAYLSTGTVIALAENLTKWIKGS